MPGTPEAVSSVLAASISCFLICLLAHCLSPLPSMLRSLLHPKFLAKGCRRKPGCRELRAGRGVRASPICFSRAAASQMVARGRMPGSVKLVCRRQLMTKKKRMAAMMGMARVSVRAR